MSTASKVIGIIGEVAKVAGGLFRLPRKTRRNVWDAFRHEIERRREQEEAERRRREREGR